MRFFGSSLGVCLGGCLGVLREVLREVLRGSSRGSLRESQGPFMYKVKSLVLQDGDLSWTVNSCGHFFSRLLLNSHRQFLFLGEFSWIYFG